VVAIPAGPGPEDVARVADLVDALRACEPRAPEAVVVVDDASPRPWPAGVTAIPNPRRGRGIGTLGGTCAATFAALAHAHEHHPGAWVLRIDADALVVGPYADAIEEAWRPGDGVLGSCSRTCNGEPRDVSWWAREVARHERRVWAFAHPPRRPFYVRPAHPRVRGVLLAARAAGYRPGEHCIAAGCAISAPLVAALHARGWLERPQDWIHARLGDDIALGAMARACGLGLRDLPSVFGLRHVGLPDTPQRLLDRGFAVVHSVKNDPDVGEDEARAFFAAARAGA
jgi:hypothetical protein